MYYDLFLIFLIDFSLPMIRLNTGLEQPPPQAVRFSQGRGERLVMSRKGPWEGYRRLPAFLCTRERETGQRREEGHYENYWVTSNQCLYPR